MTPGINDTILFNNLKALGYEVFPLVAKENAKSPFIIYHNSTNNVSNYLNSNNNYNNVIESNFIIKVYSTTYRQLKVMTDEVIKNLSSINNLNTSEVIIFSSQDSKEEDDFVGIIQIKIITRNE
jgi:esterase/lipase